MAASSHVLHTPLGNIHYWVTRAGETLPWLIFLPGLSADRRLFGKQMAFFRDKVNCLVWDAPAHGLSRPFSLDFSAQDLARWLREILTDQNIQKPVFVGQSMGGYISQLYMAAYPDHAAGFVSIDSCSLSRKYYSALELKLLRHTKGLYMSIPWKLLLKWGIPGTSASAYGRDLMEKMWGSYEKEEYCALADRGYRILAEAVEAREEYRIPCPVLLLCGTKDNAGSAKRYNRQWTRQDGHRLVWINGAGHNANTDDPDTVNRLIFEFVQSLP